MEILEKKEKLKGNILKGCILTTILYFITFFLAARIFEHVTNTPIDNERKISAPFMGVCLITIPYIFNGIYCRMAFSGDFNFEGALKTSLILVVSERVLIYAIGFLIVLAGGDGSMDVITTMMFIQGEAAPYFTTTYILAGVFSICISVLISAVGKNNRHIKQ